MQPLHPFAWVATLQCRSCLAVPSHPGAWLQTYNVTFLTTWIKDHVAAATALGKPIIVEEFGKQVRTAAMQRMRLLA